MKLSIWLYEENSHRDFNIDVDVSNFRIFLSSELFGTSPGLLIYPKNFEDVGHGKRYLVLLKQNRRMFERLGNHKAIKHLELNI